MKKTKKKKKKCTNSKIQFQIEQESKMEIRIMKGENEMNDYRIIFYFISSY